MSSKSLRYKLEAATALPLLGLFRLMGLHRASAFSGSLLRFLGPKVGVTRRARNNIERVLPHLSADEVDSIIADMWENIGRTLAEYAHLDAFSAPGNEDLIRVKGLDRLAALRDQGAMLVSGHFANWELMPLAVHQNGYEGGEIYRHANNPTVNEWIIKLRSRAIHPVQIPKGPKGARDVIRIVRNKGFICMLVDQKMNDGVEATLFGRKAMTPSTPGSMATRYGIPIMPVTIRRTDGVHFEQEFHDPIFADPDADPHQETLRITQRLNDFIEAEIRANTAQWLWLHNRWPAET